MSLRFARYIHQQTPGGKLNGFSVYFYPSEQDGMVCYSIALCSAKDHFNKRTARELCLNTEEHTCRIVVFPAILFDLYELACRGKSSRHPSNMYTWVYKYFL